MNVRIGTSGYAYREWVGTLYPHGTSQHDMLPCYAKHFAVVEINSTFYRPPTTEQVAKMARRSPPGFGFTLKVPQTISHEFNPDDLPTFKLAADRLGAAGKLHGLIFQVPESFRNTRDNREWVTRVGGELRPHRVAVEFRHRSWAAVNLREWMEHVGLDLVSVDAPQVPTLFPSGLRVANRRVYARLHSRNADNWYGGGKLRYDYLYSDEALSEWVNGLVATATAGTADECLVFFNNCVGAQATVNAQRFTAMLTKASPAINVIAAPAPVTQPSLFDGV